VVATSKLSTSNHEDFALDFSKCQTLRELQSRMQHTICILNSQITIAKGIAVHVDGLKARECILSNEAELLQTGLAQHIGFIEGHIRRVEGLLQTCNFNAQMVSTLLYRPFICITNNTHRDFPTIGFPK
jgi:hypothetical protein